MLIWITQTSGVYYIELEILEERCSHNIFQHNLFQALAKNNVQEIYRHIKSKLRF